jgi:lipoate-protein ligase A
MSSWRLLNLSVHDAFANMAIDEAILTARTENLASNTLRLYCWRPSAVSVGRFQSMTNEVYLDNCREHGVDVVRRITGGGTVYHEADNEVTYSIIADKRELGTEDLAAIYAKIYSGLARAISLMGASADFNEGNAKTCPNLTVEGRKVSGSAQSHRKGVVLQHGTLLLDVDLDKMFAFIRVPWAETRAQVVNIAPRKITSLGELLGRRVAAEEAGQALVQGFREALDAELMQQELTEYERKLTDRLLKEKYTTDDWNLLGKTAGE